MFWQGEPFKATWLGTTHRWGQKTRCLLTAFDEAVLFQEIGDVVLISPTFSQTDLFFSLHEYLILGYEEQRRDIPEKSVHWASSACQLFWGSLRFGLRGETCWGEKPTPRRRTDMLIQDVRVCCMLPTIKTSVPREFQLSSAPGELRCSENECFRVSGCPVLDLRSK